MAPGVAKAGLASASVLRSPMLTARASPSLRTLSFRDGFLHSSSPAAGCAWTASFSSSRAPRGDVGSVGAAGGEAATSESSSAPVAPVLAALRSRGLVAAVTSEEAVAAAARASPPSPVYLGIDPTADSMHVGNLLCVVTLSWFARFGHTPVLLVGGATGAVGDPSGKDKERPLLAGEAVAGNARSIADQAQAILSEARLREADAVAAESIAELVGQGVLRGAAVGNESWAGDVTGASSPIPPSVVVNNLDWWKDVSLLDFLRTAGRQTRVGPMLAREAVRARLAKDGLSYTEFSYQLLQAYDFVHLHSTMGCAGQIGGTDQWGNITAGTDAIRRGQVGDDFGEESQGAGDDHAGTAAAAAVASVPPPSAFGLTIPLLTRADGTKYGKSESGAIWLSPERMSPYGLYQALFATPDADVCTLLRMLTAAPLWAVDEFAAQIRAGEIARPNAAQKLLAECVTALAHGHEGLEAARRATAALAPGSTTPPDHAALRDLLASPGHPPVLRLPRASLLDVPFAELLAAAELAPSRSAARRLVDQGGARANNAPVGKTDVVREEHLLGGELLLLSAGKKRRALVVVDEEAGKEDGKCAARTDE